MADLDQYEDKPKEEGKGNERQKYVRFWLDAIDAQRKDDKNWLDQARNAVKIYRSEADSKQQEFNIFHSNIETTLPAIYNSTPVPDVRRRFGDKDKVAKTVSQLLERCLSFSVDNYDFSETMRQVLFDGLVPGRGVARVRYVPYFVEQAAQEPPEAPESVANTPDAKPTEQLAYEEVSCEYVPYQKFIIGPGDTWEDVPWIAFEHMLTRKEVEKLVGSAAKAKKVQLDYRIDGTQCEDDDEREGDIFKRARVYEIWDKDERKVRFIATGYTTEPLLEEDDPLGLESFWPVPRPVQPIMTPGNMVPVCPFEVYKSLVDELNEITFRIKKIVRQIRVRGGYGGGEADLTRLMEADDGELVPLEGLEALLAGGGDIGKAIAWWPIEPAVKALAQLYQQREQVKQTIYEVTGISDIVRGASKASETATAQEIKNQWGSLRIQQMQGAVQRFARDIFRIKAEIIAKKFSPQTVMMISGMMLLPKEQHMMLQQQMQPPPPQPGMPPAPPPPPLPEEVQKALEHPPAEDVFGVMQSDLMRSYKVDVESDSTIRADLTRNQRSMSEFLQGSAQFVAAVGPAVQTGQMPGNVAAEIYAAFARNFKLGKQAEDALDKMAENASKPQPPKPDPEAEKAKMQMQIEQQKMAHQTQLEQAKMQLEQVKAEQQAALEQQKMELEREKAAQELDLKRQIAMLEMQIKQETTAAELQMKGEQANMALEKDHEIKRMQLNSTHELGRAKIASDGMLNAKKIRTMNGEDPADAETPDSFDQLASAIKEMAQAVIQSNEMQIKSNEMIMKAITAPKIGRRNPDGSMSMQTVMQ